MADENRSPYDLEVPDLALPSVGPGPLRAARPEPAPPAVPDEEAGGLGMEIERDISQPFQGPASTPLERRPRPSSSGLEVTYRRLDPRSTDNGVYRPKLALVLGPLVAVIAAGSVFAGFARLVHRPAGVELTRIAPHAFDGTSVAASGVVAVIALVLSIAIGYAGVKPSSRSWLLVGAAASTMLLALAMVTVTLASSGEHGPPPDGALLVPWAVPFAMALAGLDLGARGAKRMARREGARKLSGLPLALVAGALLFLALEGSRFASLLPLLD